MAINRMSQQLYGPGVPLVGVFADPIISRRSPVSSDKAPIGTPWINSLTNETFSLASITNNVSNWVSDGRTSGQISFDSLTATIGNITADLGDIVATAGDIIVTAGDIVVSAASQSLTIETDLNLLGATGNLNIVGNFKVNKSTPSSLFAARNGDLTTSNLTATTDPAQIILEKKNGAGDGRINSGDNIGRFSTTPVDLSALVYATCSGSTSTGVIPSDLSFETADGTGSLSNAMKIEKEGDLSIVIGDIKMGGNTIRITGSGNGTRLIEGSGDPNGVFTTPKASLFLRDNGSSGTDRVYINITGGNTWTAFTTVA